jgi:UDP-N-acetylmuramate--alanine ligase
LLSHLLQQGGVDCTAFLGGISRNFASNFVLGTSEYLVAEADEFDRSFLTLSPWAAVITSLDPDHLDIYGTAGAMKESYREFAAKASQSLLLHSDLPVADWQLDHQTYGVEEGDFQAQGLRYHELSTWFDYQSPAQRIEGIRLPLPGQHNVANAVAAMALAEQAGADPATFKSSLEGFRGIYRRFEAQLHTARLTYIDDYAHHPREIQAAMETARKLFPNRKLLVVFQPHLYSRTRDFLPGFAQALAQADSLLMLDIYPAREAPIEGVTSQAVLDQVELKNKALVAKNELIEAIAQRVDDPTVLLSLGAGDIDRLVPHMKTWAESYALQFQ